MATDQNDRMAYLRQQADEYTQMAEHNERESIKLQQWRAKRVATLQGQANQAAATRTAAGFTAGDIAYAWGGTDPKLAEYSAGMVIVERRAAMYATMAANVRAEIQTLILLQLLAAQTRRTA